MEVAQHHPYFPEEMLRRVRDPIHKEEASRDGKLNGKQDSEAINIIINPFKFAAP